MEVDRTFKGSIPAVYDTYLGPMIFAPYADDLVSRIADLQSGRVLETAAGTGVVTRALVAALPPAVAIDATDLNQPMLDHAASTVPSGRVAWRQADAQSLPFPDGVFDAVLCQFGVMFFPDKAKAFAEAFRVLKPGGRFIFNVWDRLEENEFAAVAVETGARLFPDDPPMFLARTPHGHADTGPMEVLLRSCGFANVTSEPIDRQSIAPDARSAAIGYCQGTPMRNEIEARAAERLGEVTEAVAEAIASRFGGGKTGSAVTGRIRAHVITARR